MSVQTEIEGSPGGIEGVADWLRDSLAPALEAGGDAMNDSRSSADASWHGTAGEEFSGTMKSGRDAIDGLEGAVRSMAGDLEDFAGDLRRCQGDMAEVRRVARAAGLTVSDFVVEDPGSGPARPPDGFEGTPAEVEAHNARVEAYDAHQELVEAYNDASTEAARVDRAYATACQSLQDDYTVGQHAAWIVTVTDVIGDAAAVALAVDIARRQSPLLSRAQDLLGEAERAIDDLQAHPERYVRRHWIFFERLDEARLEADRLAIEGRLNDAEDLVRRSDDLAGGGRPGRFLRGFGRALGAAGVGLGVWNDYQEGESTEQIVVSQGGSLLAGMGAGAAVGAAVGSVVPVAGTAVGAVVGTVIGAGVSIFADGAIDSLFENGPDVGEAFESGVDALQDTGEAIGDAASGVADTVGGWFS